MIQAESPCLHCTRVPEPELCENKNCMLWQRWFLRRWDDLRSGVRAHMEAAQLQPTGVPLGGRRYESPHRVRAYLANDPCDTCLCPKDLCHTPCPVRRAWEQQGNEGAK